MNHHRLSTLALTKLLALLGCEAAQPEPNAARDPSRPPLTAAATAEPAAIAEPAAPGPTAPLALPPDQANTQEAPLDERQGQAAPQASGQIAPRPPDPADTLPATDVDALRCAQAELGVALLADLVVTSPDAPHLLLSPYAIHSVLSMIMAGARGDDQTALRDALRVGALEDRAHKTAAAFNSVLRQGPLWGERTKYGLTLLNRVWIDEKIKLKRDYLGAMHQDYSSQLAQADLSGDQAGAIARINGWAKAVSEARFDPLMEADALPPNAALMTISAIHMFGHWEHPFDAQDSAEGDFKRADGTTSRVTMMRLRAPLRYAREAGHELIVLPSNTIDWELVLALPTGEPVAPDALARALLTGARRGAAVQRPLDRDAYLKAAPHPHQPTTRLVWEGGAPTRQLDVLLPRLTMRSTLNLEAALAKLGFAKLITPGVDLSGLSASRPARQLKLALARHEAQLSLDEGGYGSPPQRVDPVQPSAPDHPPDALQLRFDRPFTLAVRDVKTGLLVMVGQVHDVR